MEQELSTLLPQQDEGAHRYQDEERHNYCHANSGQRKRWQFLNLRIGATGVVGTGFLVAMLLGAFAPQGQPASSKVVVGESIVELIAPPPEPVPPLVPIVTSFNCEVGLQNVQQDWSQQKRNWCCKKEFIGCPFDCQDGLKNWETGWSKLKKSWCCKTLSIGCSNTPSAIDASADPFLLMPSPTPITPMTLLPTTPTTATTSLPPTTPTTTEPCHTALKGEHCYDAVIWAYYSGFTIHPEWYPGLNQDSNFENFQATLHAKKLKGCPKPCNTQTKLPARKKPTTAPPTTTKKPWGYPSLFCFSVARGFNPEMDLMKTQLQKSAGIFACDEQAVLSDHVEDLGGGFQTIVTNIVNQGGISRDGTAANTQTFVNAWHTIQADGRFRSHDFTVKTDPDTVLLPDRLRKHLNPHNGANVYFANCDMRDRYPSSTDFPMMYGALEVLSKAAVEAYLYSGPRCQNELPWQSWGEDLFMGHCMQHLGVGQVVDTGIIQDANCRGVDCHNGWAAAFHHFKDSGAWLDCYYTATR